MPGYLGSYGNAANTVAFPLTVVALSIAVMIGDGYCSFISISLGIPFYMFGQMLNPNICSDGSPKFAHGIPVVGYNIGAGRKDRAEALFLLTIYFKRKAH